MTMDNTTSLSVVLESVNGFGIRSEEPEFLETGELQGFGVESGYDPEKETDEAITLQGLIRALEELPWKGQFGVLGAKDSLLSSQETRMGAVRFATEKLEWIKDQHWTVLKDAVKAGTVSSYWTEVQWGRNGGRHRFLGRERVWGALRGLWAAERGGDISLPADTIPLWMAGMGEGLVEDERNMVPWWDQEEEQPSATQSLAEFQTGPSQDETRSWAAAAHERQYNYERVRDRILALRGQTERLTAMSGTLKARYDASVASCRKVGNWESLALTRGQYDALQWRIRRSLRQRPEGMVQLRATPDAGAVFTELGERVFDAEGEQLYAPCRATPELKEGEVLLGLAPGRRGERGLWEIWVPAKAKEEEKKEVDSPF